MSRPNKPNISVPSEFAVQGQKADFNEDKILNGFKSYEPDVLSGENFNKFIDDTYKASNYALDLGDYVLGKNQISNCILEAPNGVLTYSGNTITLKAGVKVLIPDGRNSDGSLKNIEVTIPNDVTYTITDAYMRNRQNQPIFLDEYGVLKFTNCMPNRYFVTDGSTSGTWDVNYSPKTNIIKNTAGTAGQWTTSRWVYIGSLFIDDNINITNANIEQPIKIFTSADKSYLGSLGMPSNKYIDLTLGASGSTYKAPADGFVAVQKQTNNNNQYVSLNTGCLTLENNVPSGNSTISLYLPVTKDDTITVYYNASGATRFFRFVYAVGSESQVN